MKKRKILWGFLWLVMGIITVNAATVDITPPVLKSISFKEEKAYNPGEKVYLNIDANDDISGINSIYVGIRSLKLDNPGQGGISGTTAEVYNIDYEPYIILPYNLPSGTWLIDEIGLNDRSNNDSHYTCEQEFVDLNTGYIFLDYDLKFQVLQGNQDLIKPTLETLVIDKTEVNYGEYFKITAKVNDDNSGVKEVLLKFRGPNSDYDFNTYLNEENEELFSNMIASPFLSGKYNLYEVWLTDYAGNTVVYGDSTSEYPDHNLQYSISFTVNNSTGNSPDVKIVKINYQYKKLITPNIYKISLELDDNTSLIDSADIIIAQKKNNSKDFNRFSDYYFQAFLHKDENGLLSTYVDIDQFKNIGEYYLAEIKIYNSSDSNNTIYTEINNKLEYEKVDLFEIIENDTFDIITSTNDKDLIEKIINSTDNSKIAISSSNFPIIKKEVFEAIKGTNKTIYIEGAGIQWIFNGKDIVNPKDINVNVTFNYLYNDDINDKLMNIVSKGLVINFSDNGQLPGKALIRIKTDYALRDYIGIENLFVYYFYDEDTVLLKRVANNISMTDDGFFEFYIDHNSTFIVANTEADSNYVSNSTDELKLNQTSINKLDITKNTLLIICLSLVLILILVLIVFILKKRKILQKNRNMR